MGEHATPKSPTLLPNMAESKPAYNTIAQKFKRVLLSYICAMIVCSIIAYIWIMVNAQSSLIGGMILVFFIYRSFKKTIMAEVEKFIDQLDARAKTANQVKK